MKWFKDRKVGIKVFLSYLVFMIITGIVSMQGIISMNRANFSFDEFYRDRFIAVIQLNDILAKIYQIRINMMQEQERAGYGDWAEVNKLMSSTKDLIEAYQKEWKGYITKNLIGEEAKIAKDWERLVEVTRDIGEEFAMSLIKKRVSESEEILEMLGVEVANLNGKTKELIDIQKREGELLKSGQERAARNLFIMAIIILGVAIFFGILITIVLARSVSIPVSLGLAFAERFAKGDLTARIGLDQDDELGQLGKALNHSAQNLEELVDTVIFAAQGLAQAVDQISSGNQNLAQRTSEQASSLEEIASTVEEATATSKLNADNAREANSLAGNTSSMAEEGGRLSAEAVRGIYEINEVSRKIGDISNVINEISFQTNLLALNASVEAARAGEAGRGFAVVAGEIRNLAQRSGNASKEIGSLINETITRIDTGSLLVNRSGDSLKNIIGAINGVTRMVSEIYTSNSEQKLGMDQLTIAVSEMDSMTQQNAALVEETASASEEMSNQAQELLSLTRKFTTGGIRRSIV